jgi:hypothetical protein
MGERRCFASQRSSRGELVSCSSKPFLGTVGASVTQIFGRDLLARQKKAGPFCW